ncbi:hypothetical protein BJ322DRAFT_459110 [Thelephora terrestris]|uniref:Nitrogen regulatory protein areA GATA-like domain-containing protein n=1 Tax=Thelephora terrestris TaxID=56493 RepID=A0A9P6L1Q5_9AGAM|nr:hypothetical protein BJ322DRAFT_459110 [Thelephora terrestris]
MLSNLSSPILSLAADVVKDLEGEVAVYSFWSVLTKCKNSVKDGRRLENLSWRLWHREMSTSTASSNHPPPTSPMVMPSYETDLPVLVSPSPSPVLGATLSPLPRGVPSPIIHPLTSVPSLDTIVSPRIRLVSPAGKIICGILPERIALPPRQLPSPDVSMCAVDISSPSPAPSTTVSTLLAPVTSNTGAPPFPKVVIVNPTPHPTPPATPLSSHQAHHTGMNPINHPPSHLTPSRLPAPPSRSPGLVSATPELDPNAGTALTLPHRLHAFPPQLAIPQYNPRPPTSQLAQQYVSTTRPTVTATLRHVTVPEFPTTDQPVLSHQSRFFFRESPEQIDSSPDRAGSALGRIGGDGRTNTGDDGAEARTSRTETAQRAVSERSDSLDADVVVHPFKALTGTPSSVGSKDSRRSTSLHRNKRNSATGVPPNNAGATTRRKAGHQVAGRPARPTTARMNSKTIQNKRTKSNSNVPMTTNLAMARTTSRRSEAGNRADSKDRSKVPPSPVTPIQPNQTAADVTPMLEQKTPTPAAKRRANSANSHEKRLSTGHKNNLQHPPMASQDEGESQTAQIQRRGIVAEDDGSSSNSDFETEDSDDSEWASEEISQVEDDKPPAKANGKSTGKGKKKTEDEASRRAREVAEEEERKRRETEMFAKLPRKSYTNLPEGIPGVGGVESLYGPPRTKSGLLTQLLNPDPLIFPSNHPYRTSFSSQDVTAYSRMNPALTVSRVQAAKPQATRTQVTVNNYPAAQLNGNGAGPSDLRAGGKYRPRGRPDGAEMDDSDGEEDDNRLAVSTSLAQQRLAALVGPRRRGLSRRQNSDPQPQPTFSQRGINHEVVEHTNAVNPNNITPIPLHHPYNLPPPTAPSTPRTTRRHMLSTELSESLRRNLLWERQVSKVGGQPYQRRPVSALNPGIRPLTSVNESQASGSGSGDTDSNKPESKEERRRKALDRNRSWADEYHYSGW